jgi:A/G-specific adenine glycosylase
MPLRTSSRAMQQSPPMPDSPLHQAILTWYASHRRMLPWRSPGVTPWQVLVSEVMLQQTPVDRVLPVYAKWLEQWPTPAHLAAASPGEAVRTWGRLGYPRRAIRLREAASTIVSRHDGEVPDDHAALLALPGVGTYTAAAVLSFGFGRRQVVLDTNVRRVLARLVLGRAHATRSVTAAERSVAESVTPDRPSIAATWSVATMELGALVCTARAPACHRCPVATCCRWREQGYQAGPRPIRVQRYAGTDRHCRGTLLSVLRDATEPVPQSNLESAWSKPSQRQRSLDSLIADGLVESLPGDRFRLPVR